VRRRSKAPSTASAHAAESTAVASRKARGLFGIACLCVLGLTAFLGTSAPSAAAAEKFPGQGFLPNDRAWEMVSPPNKNGGEVTANSTRTHAAADGGAVIFTSLAGFGDLSGMGVGAEYMSVRSGPGAGEGNGWLTHGVTPPQDPLTLTAHAQAAEPFYERQFSDDLDSGVFRAWTPLTDEPNVAGAYNLYVRRDLRSPGVGSYQLATACPDCESPLDPLMRVLIRPWFAGASEDFEHVLFEYDANLTEDAPPHSIPFLCTPEFQFFGCDKRVYELDGDTVRLASVLPDGTGTRAMAGQGVSNGLFPVARGEVTLRPISSDGSRIAFTAIPSNSAEDGTLYQRIDGRTTIQLHASERAVPDTNKPAKYWDASADHSRVFFTTQEALTEDAPINGDDKLYMWQRQDSDEQQQVTVDASGGSFTLSFHGATTSALPFNAPAGDVEAALEQLVSVKAGNVAVSGGPGAPGGTTPYTVTFTGDFAGANVAELSADGTLLSGGAATATVATTEPVDNLTYLSKDEEPGDVPNIADVRGVIGASDDGRYVYFASQGQLVEGAPPLDLGAGIYLWHDGELSYVGEYPEATPGELIPGLAQQVSVLQQSRVTPDGRHLLFGSITGEGLLSAHGGVDYDHGSCPSASKECRELYAYSADTDELRCASCIPSGAPATVDATGPIRANSGASGTSEYRNHPLTDDGRFVFFSTREALVPEDLNGRSDAYVYDTQSETPHLLSSGTEPTDSYFLDASGDGKDAFFVTNEKLSAWDVDQGYDVYDARIGGGFPEPAPAPPSCQGDACQPTPLSLNDPTPASSSFNGAGDPKPRANPARKGCPKGKRKVRTRQGKARCVKRAQRKNSNRNANSNRRAGR
jgi:hypothetical protein